MNEKKQNSRQIIFSFFILLTFFSPALKYNLQAQDLLTVSGKVLSDDGSPLAGATVGVKNANKSTATGNKGQFTLTGVSRNATLVVSFTGYSKQEIAVNGESSYAVTLIKDEAQLSDVVVVGYGTQRKSQVTGSIASVKAADLVQTPIANVAQGLQARVSGLQITQNNAAPGGNISVRIRGTNSINGSSEPLYIIDGIQVSNEGGLNDASPLSTINPNDIESVDILKDASATAIYGARAANGVVLITTKRGKNGPTRVQLEGYTGVQSITKKINLLNASQFAQLENEIYNNNNYPDPGSLGKGTDWQELVYRSASINNAQLSVSGGAEKTQFAISGSYFNQDGIIINSGFKRYSLHLSIDHKINDHFKIGTTIIGSQMINNGIPTGSTSMDGAANYTSVVGATLGAPPTLKPYKDDGTIYSFVDQGGGRYSEVVNPLGLAEVFNQTTLRRNLANVYAEVKVIRGLTYRANFNIDLSNSLNDYYSPISIIAQANVNASSGTARKINVNAAGLLHESILTYERLFGEHSLKITGVYAAQSNTTASNTINANGFPNDATTNEALALAANHTVSSQKTNEKLNSYMGRINYGYKNKYFLDLTTRYDGASKFGANNKNGFFPAISGAWRISQESFMQNQDIFSDLKLRLSYGMTGNAAAISPYQSLSLLSSGSNYQFNHVYTVGLSPIGIANNDLKWEKSRQTDIGLDIGILNNRINFVIDAYQKKTEGLLFIKALPLSSGYSSFQGNFASIENKGIELAINTRIIDKQVRWNVNGNISFNRNKLTSLEGGLDEFVLSPYSVLKVGQPLGIYKTYVFDGIYQTGETILPGQTSRIGGTKLVDLNKDGQITSADQKITGNSNPNYIFGLSTDISYKNFDFSAFISGVQGNQLYNLSRYTFENPLGSRNVLAGLINRWSPSNPNNEYQNGSQGGRLPISDRFLENGSYIRLKNITLGYKLPTIKWISRARVYVSGNNLFTITKYTGYDPEVNSFGGSNSLVGIDNLVYPAAKSFLIGLQLGF